MNEFVTETSHAQCELCRILKTARMTEQSADNQEIIKKKKDQGQSHSHSPGDSDGNVKMGF